MAPQRKRLGVGAECVVALRYLHPKDKVNERIPNQTSNQKLEHLVVQAREERPIRREAKLCVVFHHEDFGGQPLWCLPKYIKIQVEGPPECWFDPSDGSLPTGVVAEGGGGQGEGQQGENVVNNSNENDATNNQNDIDGDLPVIIQRLVENASGTTLDAEDIVLASSAAPMVDDDDAPAPENVPQPNDAADDIMIGWQHAGVCQRSSTIRRNVKPELHNIPRSVGAAEITNLQLFELLFFRQYIQDVIIPATNKQLEEDHEPLTYGEFLRWLGLWLLMATIIGPQRHEFWSSLEINAFHGAPLRLGVWMSKRRFNAILSALQYTNHEPPAFVDKFWEVRQMLSAWGENMNQQFSPGYVNCLDESMSVWTNKFTCPGFMFVPRKPWPFGNEYHTVCCCQSGIMWGIELVEGKDRPSIRYMPRPAHDEMGATVGLLLRLLAPIYAKGLMVILDSGFCVLKGIIELCIRGVYASALIKKRRYWPKYIRGDEIKEHFAGKEVGDTDAWEGKLNNTLFHIYAMKEPDYVMSLMATYGTNLRIGEETRRDWKEGGVQRTATFQYPEVVHNHFKYRHAVDDHNAKRHSPISLEVVWATKRWPNRVFAFLLAITEVNCWLAESYFTHRKTNSMLEFRKKLSYELIENGIIHQEEEKERAAQQRRRSSRLRAEQGHELMALPPYKKFKDGEMVPSQSRYPQHKCSGCRSEVRSFCSCSPGVYLCKSCFGRHCIEAVTAPRAPW